MTNSLTLIQMNTFGTCWVVLMTGLLGYIRQKVGAAVLEDCYALHSRGYSNHLSPGWGCAL